jgi:hypothetical protein
MQDQVVECLRATLSPQGNVRAAAEAKLKEVRSFFFIFFFFLLSFTDFTSVFR